MDTQSCFLGHPSTGVTMRSVPLVWHYYDTRSITDQYDGSNSRPRARPRLRARAEKSSRTRAIRNPAGMLKESPMRCPPNSGHQWRSYQVPIQQSPSERGQPSSSCDAKGAVRDVHLALADIVSSRSDLRYSRPESTAGPGTPKSMRQAISSTPMSAKAPISPRTLSTVPSSAPLVK